MDQAVFLEREACSLALIGVCELLDAMEIPAILVDRQSQVLKINAFARRMIAAESTILDGQILTSDSFVTASLFALLESAGVEQPRAISIPRPSNPPIIIYGIRFSGVAADAFEPAYGILLLIDPNRRPSPSQAQLSEAFGLTCLEARVTLGLAQGDSLEDTARSCAISYETARTLIKSVYRKTGVNRQAAVVALIHRSALVPHI